MHTYFERLSRKSWEIHLAKVNPDSGREGLRALPAEKVAPTTHQMAELTIRPRMLLYGVYKLTFTSRSGIRGRLLLVFFLLHSNVFHLTTRMWDRDESDPNWTRQLPFESKVSTYIRVLES